jgi:hypothetical protein
MKAWMITWENAEVRRRLPEKIAALLSPRLSSSRVAELVELLMLRATCDAGAMAYCARRPKERLHRAATSLLINQIPHGDRVLCGQNPWLYGRKVSELSVSREGDMEVLSWREPPTIRWKNKATSEFGPWKDGEVTVHRRPVERPVSQDIWRWRN